MKPNTPPAKANAAERPLLRGLLTIVGLIALLALVWFVGPLITLGGAAPLASEVARWEAVAAVAVLAALMTAWRGAQAGRNNRLMLEKMMGESNRTVRIDTPLTQAAAPGAKEVEVIGERFAQAVAMLKRRRIGAKRSWLGALGGQPYVYELPWYVIIGAPGAGKTTALVNSGLEFPLAAQLGKKMIRGIGGTRNCDWWFATDAVLIDTAGRYTTHESDRAADRTAWLGFLDLLAQYRPGRPLNGVLLTLSANDLLNPDADKRLAHARDLRERIDELHARLGIRLPIYVMVTKTDLLAGFVEFFADFDKDERAQVWGVTFPYDTDLTSDDPLARMPSDLAALERRLNECLIDRLQAEHDRDRRAAIYAFPQQWRVLHESLLELLPVVFGPSAVADDKSASASASASASPSSINVASASPRPLLRGLYFTSATQEGTPMDRAIGGLARTLGLASKIVPPTRSSAKTFFVTRMLRDVVLLEAGLAGTHLGWQRRRASLAWALTVATVVIVAGVCAMSWYAYDEGRTRIASTTEQVAALKRDVDAAKASAPTDLTALLPALDSLQALGASGSASPGGDWLPAWLDARINQSAMFAAAARDAYQGLLKDAFLPRVAARLEERLRSGGKDHLERLYEDLKAYLMLFGGKNFDAAALRSFLGADWDATLPSTVSASDRDSLRHHLDRLLAGGEVGAPSQAEPKIVDSTRKQVASVPLAQRAYGRLKQADLGASAPAFTVESAAGPAARRVFARASGQPLDRGVPGLYTRAVYQDSFRQRTQDVLRQLAGEQGWVLGTSGASAMEPAAQAQLIDQIERTYLSDYTRQWDEFIGDLRLAPDASASLAASAETAQMLSHADSPLQALLRGVVREVSVAPSRAAVATTGASAPTSVATSATTSTVASASAAASGAPSNPSINASPNSPSKTASSTPEEHIIDPRFDPLRQFVVGQPSPLDGTLTLLGRLSTHLSAVDDAVKRKTMPPSSDVIRDLSTAASHAPVPVSAMLVQLTQASAGQAFVALREPLARQLTDEVGTACARATAGRYPLVKGGSQEISRDEFAKTFAAGGVLDGFFQRNLAPYVDTSARPWAYRRPDGTRGESAEALQQFQRAQAIRQAFFREGGRAFGAPLEFKLLDMDPSVKLFTLDVDGQVLRFGRDQKSVQTAQWPGTGTTGRVHLQVTPTGGGNGSDYAFDGPWALFRLFDRVRVEPGSTPDRAQLTFDIEGRKVRFEVRSATPLNPLLRGELEQFQCPKRL